MKFYNLLKKGALYLTTAFTLAAGGDFAWRTTLQKSTPLSTEQITQAHQIFGSSMDYNKVRTINGKFSVFQPGHLVVALGNTIYCPKGRDMPTSLLYHELTHIWQNQNNIKNTGVTGAAKLYMQYGAYHSYGDRNCYAYVADAKKKLTDYNMEQQAEIIEEYAFLRFVSPPTAKEPDKQNSLQTLEKIISTDIPVTPPTKKDHLPKNIP